MQLLRLRWGRVVEDLIFEDTLALDAELRRSEHSGEQQPVAGGPAMSIWATGHEVARVTAAGSPPPGGASALRLDRVLYRATRGRVCVHGAASPR